MGRSTPAGEMLGFTILSGMITPMFQNGMSLQADRSHLKNDFKLQEMMVASPTGPGVYVAGMAVSELVYSSPAIFILAVLFALYVPVTTISALAISVVLLLMFLPSVSLAFAWPPYPRTSCRAAPSPASSPRCSPPCPRCTAP